MIKKNILITGGLGLLGFNLFNFLNEKKYNVFVLDKNTYIYKKLKLQNNRKIIIGNYLDLNLIKKIIKKKKINIIFHLGAITQVLEGIKYPRETFENNIQGTVNILEMVRKINKNIIIIFSSTDKAYGELNSKGYKENDSLKAEFPYDLSKSSADLICQSYSKFYQLKIGIIRCGNIFGKFDFNENRIIPETIKAILNKKNIMLRSSGNLKRDYLYVNDAVEAYFLLMRKILKGKGRLHIYNVGSKYNFTVKEVVNKIIKFSSSNKTKIIIKNNSKFEIKSQKLNYLKIVNELKWKQRYSFNYSISETFDWYKSNLKLFHKN